MDPIQQNLLKQTWFNQWHLYAAWLYLIIVAFDFLLAPVVHTIILAYFHYKIVQWQPITLQGGGIFHISMMAIIGISTFGKSQQLVEAIRNMPDYSNNQGDSSNQNNQPYEYNATSFSIENNIPPLNPNIDPSTVLKAPHRGIPKGN